MNSCAEKYTHTSKSIHKCSSNVFFFFTPCNHIFFVFFGIAIDREKISKEFTKQHLRTSPHIRCRFHNEKETMMVQGHKRDVSMLVGENSILRFLLVINKTVHRRS